MRPLRTDYLRDGVVYHAVLHAGDEVVWLQMRQRQNKRSTAEIGAQAVSNGGIVVGTPSGVPGPAASWASGAGGTALDPARHVRGDGQR